MGKANFSIELMTPPEILMNKLISFEEYPKYLSNIKDVKIISKNNDEIITEDSLEASTIIKYSLKQQSIHKILPNNQLVTKIISGPAKNSVIKVNLEKEESTTKVIVDIDLKLSLKAKILEPIFKKWYKLILRSILFKIDAETKKSC